MNRRAEGSDLPESLPLEEEEVIARAEALKRLQMSLFVKSRVILNTKSITGWGSWGWGAVNNVDLLRGARGALAGATGMSSVSGHEKTELVHIVLPPGCRG